MTTKATAAVIREPKGQFELETVELEDPRPDEILVRIEASGVCHTDAKAQERVPMPAVLGHEGTGVVEAVGSAVTQVTPGDRVIISYPSCGTCPNCIDGKAYICDHALPLSFAGTRLDGSKTVTMNGESISSAFFQQSSFSTHAITLERDVVPVKGDHSPEMRAAIPCGILTGAGTVLNTFNVSPKNSLVVFGAGAVGLSGIMAGHLAGVFPLIAVDVVEDRLNIALELGATHVLNAKEGDIAARIREIASRGVDFSLETSSNGQAFLDAIDCLNMGGHCGFVAAPNLDETTPFSPQLLLHRAATMGFVIQGWGTPKSFLPRIMELNQQGLFPYDRLIKTYDFSDINKAFQDSHDGIAIKPVLLMK
jgi:aryl-alcohol dehydrogenase